jgi:MFS family permease
MLAPWRSTTFLALHYRNFQHYTWGVVVSLVGTRIHEVAAGWFMWQLTESAAWVGALALVEMIPRLLLWPVAGAVVDQVDRRKLAIISQSATGVTALLLFLLTAMGLVGVYGLLTFAFLFGVNGSFWQPIRLSLIPRLIPRDALASAVGFASIVANTARIVGPILAGPVILYGSVTLAFALNAVSYVGIVTAFSLMKLPPEEGGRQGRVKLTGRDLSFGVLTVVRDPAVRILLIFIAIFAVFVRPANELLPVFAEAVFNAGPTGLSYLMAALGTGSLFSAFVVSGRKESSLIPLMAVAGATGAIMTGAFALASDIRIGLLCIALVGFGTTLANITAQILLQLSLTDDIRGRVLSIYGMLFTSVPGLGALATGWVADRIGITTPVLFGAAVGLAACLGIFFTREKLAGGLHRGQ